MNANAFRHFYAYHFAENRKIWAYVTQLTAEQFTQAVDYSHGSVRDQLIHLISCDDIWFSELCGVEPAEPLPPASARNRIRSYWDSVEQGMQAYLAELRDELLFTTPIKEPEEDKALIVWQVLLHVINHATDHRAQLLRLLNDLGVKTTAQDYIFYVYEHPQGSKGVQMTQAQPQGFLAVPPTGQGPGVLVLHAWWGLNDTIKVFCTRLAAAGFVVFAPDLYHGQVADTIVGAEALGRALDANHLQAQAEIAASTAFLLERAGQGGPQGRPGLAVVGFSLGANYALGLAAAAPAQIHSVVLFYGSGGGDFSTAQADFLGHFADNDPYEPQENVADLAETLRQAGRQVTFYQYPDTGHWFFEPDRTDAYNPAAASLAWARTLAFLQRSGAE